MTKNNHSSVCHTGDAVPFRG